jgi:hypothetical protein
MTSVTPRITPGARPRTSSSNYCILHKLRPPEGCPAATPAPMIQRDNRMDIEAAKKDILDTLEKKQKVKSKFYLKDFYKIFPDEKPRAVKNLVNKMVQEGTLEYWSSGSTTLIGLKGTGKQAAAEDED